MSPKIVISAFRGFNHSKKSFLFLSVFIPLQLYASTLTRFSGAGRTIWTFWTFKDCKIRLTEKIHIFVGCQHIHTYDDTLLRPHDLWDMSRDIFMTSRDHVTTSRDHILGPKIKILCLNSEGSKFIIEKCLMAQMKAWEIEKIISVVTPSRLMSKMCHFCMILAYF